MDPDFLPIFKASDERDDFDETVLVLRQFHSDPTKSPDLQAGIYTEVLTDTPIVFNVDTSSTCRRRDC